MTDTLPLTRRLAVLSISALLLAGAAPAAQDVTTPDSRDLQRMLRLFRQGTDMLPSEGTSPSAEEAATERPDAVAPSRTRQLLEAELSVLGAEENAALESLRSGYGTGGSGGSGGSGQPSGDSTGRFLRFLENGMQQAYGKTHREGWEILHTHVKNALSAGGDHIPPALRFAIEAGRHASYEKSYESAWEILHTTVKTTVQQPEPFLAGPAEAFPAILRLGRLCAYGKSYEDSWETLHTFTKRLDTRQELIPDDLHHFTLRQLRKGSYERSYEHAWKWLHQGVKRVERGVPNAGHYFEVTLEAKAGMSYESAWKGMRTMLKVLRDRRDLFPNEITHKALRATLTASYEKSYESAYEVLRDGTDRLRRSIETPSEYFALALKCAGGKSYEDAWDILKDFAKEALEGGMLDEFLRMQVKSSLEASYGKPYRAAYEVLRDGLRQARDM